ncbi:hypothetical protein GGH13_008064 [Coemansia sp. S155-1]|nr:hypothetical protein GGH13_008064 [Coemansia sp. S155-1]
MTKEPNASPSAAMALGMLNIPEPNIVFARFIVDDRIVPVGSATSSSKKCSLAMLLRIDWVRECGIRSSCSGSMLVLVRDEDVKATDSAPAGSLEWLSTVIVKLEV